MNYRIVARYLGLITAAIGISMVPSLGWAAYFGERHAFIAIFLSALVAVAVGLSLHWVGRGASTRLFEREAVGLVGISWILACAMGALPFFFAGILSYNDAFFESVSGFTTAGCTVITDIEAVPKSILFWRSFTHWLGGIGIVILFVAILPYFGFGGKLITSTEATGPIASRLRPRFRKNAALIAKVYAGFTVVFTLALMGAGMGFFEACCHVFGALATGGYSTRQASVAAFDSIWIELILLACMMVGGTNFLLFAAMALGNWKALWQDSEWRLYIVILAGATLLIAVNLTGMEGQFPDQGKSFEPIESHVEYGFVHALRVSAFQVVSCMTTTGYVTDDFDRWPFFSRMLLVVVMIVGGCAGSTGSGIKVIRVLMMFKIVYWRLESTFRPKTVRPLLIDNEVVSPEIQRKTAAYLYLYALWFILGCLFMSWQGLPFESAFTAVAAALNNIGPGLEHVGAVRDYSAIGWAGTLFLSFTMLLGRLEFIAILVLFMPSFWRR